MHNLDREFCSNLCNFIEKPNTSFRTLALKDNSFFFSLNISAAVTVGDAIDAEEIILDDLNCF